MEVDPGIGAPYPHNYNQIVQGEAPVGALASISPELQTTVGKLNTSFDNLNGKFNMAYKKIDRILDQTQTLLATTNRAARSAQTLISDPRLKDSVLTSAENLKQITQDARATTQRISHDLRDIIASSKGKVDKLSDNLLDLLNKVGNTVEAANTVVAKLTDEVTDPRLQQSLQETAELARATLARFNQIASDIHQLTGDPQLQNDLKVTVDKLRVATENGEQVVEKVNSLLGNVVGKGGKVRQPHLPPVTFLGYASEQFNPGKLRIDADVRVPIGGRNLIDFGVYDLGQDTRLNLQAGTQLNDALLARYGLYASKIGVGLDWQPTQAVGFRADLWDTQHPRLDARAIFRVDKEASIWVGADAIFLQPVALLGVQFKR
jgi:phospholipid/cholesterol/gamma-HCH transport system substrate-binding protein